MHCTQGSFVYRLKILHNHTASHKVLILSIKYSQDRIRGVFPSVLGVLSKVHSHGLSYFWRNPEPHDGSWPGAPGTRWFVWIVDVGRESSLPSPVFLFLLWEGGREGGREGSTNTFAHLGLGSHGSLPTPACPLRLQDISSFLLRRRVLSKVGSH